MFIMHEGINSETTVGDKLAPELRLRFGLFSLFLIFIFFLLVVVLLAVKYEPLRIPFASTAESLVADYVPFDYVIYTAVGMLIAILLVHLIWRTRLYRTKALKFDSACPNCGQHELIRMHRRRSDKVAGKLTHLPAYRFACRNCNWQGLMLPAASRSSSYIQEPSPVDADNKQAADENYRDQPEAKTAAIIGVAGEEVQDLAGSAKESGFTAVSEDGHETPQELSEIDDAQGLVPGVAYKSVAAAVSVNVTKYGGPTTPQLDVIARAMVVAPYGLKLYDRPTNHAIVLRELKSGDVIDICKNQDFESPSTWRYVAAEGDFGWVSAAFLKRVQNADGTPVAP